MYIFEYSEFGDAVSDFSAREWFERVKEAGSGIARVSTQFPIDLVRLAIIEGELDYKQVAFIFQNKIFQPNQYGNIANPPVGFCDRLFCLNTEILRAQVLKRKINSVKSAKSVRSKK